jgi:enoyl-CoA hydratase/carnithine racemase
MFRFHQDGDTASLKLDRPEARNAIPATGWAQLEAVLGRCGDARVLVVSGAGGSFCAGADLKDFAGMRDESARAAFREQMRAALDALGALPIPVVAMIEGPCYGAGVALALACDIRIAAPSARFAITPAKIGISYPLEDVQRLVALVGPGQASRLLFTAGSIDAGEAARIRLVESEAADEKAIVEAMLANDSASLAALKRTIRRAGEGRDRDSAFDRLFDEMIGGETLARRLEALWRK